MDRILLGLLIAALAGCAHVPNQAEMAAADYGPKPENAEEIARMYLDSVLLDPESARVEVLFGPRKSANSYKGLTYGWAVCARVNTKNALGGYLGRRLYYMLIRDDSVVSVIRESPDDLGQSATAVDACDPGSRFYPH